MSVFARKQASVVEAAFHFADVSVSEKLDLAMGRRHLAPGALSRKRVHGFEYYWHFQSLCLVCALVFSVRVSLQTLSVVRFLAFAILLEVSCIL